MFLGVIDIGGNAGYSDIFVVFQMWDKISILVIVSL